MKRFSIQFEVPEDMPRQDAIARINATLYALWLGSNTVAINATLLDVDESYETLVPGVEFFRHE